MDKMILLCCVIIIVLLIVILIKEFTRKRDNSAEEIKRQIERLSENRENDNRMLMEHSSLQGKSTADQVERMGRHIYENQERLLNNNKENLSKLGGEMSALRGDIGRNLEKINGVVTEKMQSTLDEKLNNLSQTVVKNFSDLGKSLSDNGELQRKSTVERLEKLELSFENIRREINSTLLNIRNSNSESMEKLRLENQASLDKINDTVNEKLQKTLDDKISKSFETVNQRLKEVYEGLGEMKSVASGVTDLKNVLSNVKTRGILGEIQLSAILEEILAPEQYGAQVNVDLQSKEAVDFAVKLPGANDDGIWLPIDSKFPGDRYAELQRAYESGSPENIKSAREMLVREIKRAAKSISEKYIKVPYTTNFAIMFLPFEGLYAEVVNMNLIEELQRDYKVNIAGPSTMAAMLNSLRMGFATLAIQKKSGEVWTVLKAAKTEFEKFEKGLDSIRNRLRLADNDLNDLIGTRTRAINKKLSSVEKLEENEAAAVLETDE